MVADDLAPCVARTSAPMIDYVALVTLQWCHNGCDGVWNHQPHDCLLNRIFMRRSKKTSKLCVAGLCAGNSPATGEFPAQRASNAENVSIWLLHNEFLPYLREEFNYLYHVNVEEWHKSKDMFLFPLKTLAHKGLSLEWLNNWSRDKMAATLQMRFSNSFPSTKTSEMCLTFVPNAPSIICNKAALDQIMTTNLCKTSEGIVYRHNWMEILNINKILTANRKTCFVIVAT